MRLTVRLVCVPCLVSAFVQSPILGQQPSVPTSEAGIMAGSLLQLDVTLKSKARQALRGDITYSLVPPSGAVQSPPVSLNHSQFSCSGNLAPDQQVMRLSCPTNIGLVSGEYRTDGKITLTRNETGDRKIEDVRTPIVTLLQNPDGETSFPDIAGTALVLSDRQSLHDGATRAQDLLISIAKELPAHPRNTVPYRAYLEQRSEMARSIVDLTRSRYISGSLGPDATPAQYKAFQAPVFFEDFDRRLNRLIRELGGNPSSPSAEREVVSPRFVLTQMPKATDSVTVTPEFDSLDKHLRELVAILTDMMDGWKKMSDSGSKTFTWSITTTPPGAEIWYSRLNEEEQKWAGLTNLKDQTLPYAIWTFRISWGNCSQTETPDPYLQSSINIQTTETGCKRK